MGVVFKARQRSLDRIVALKMIRAGEGPGGGEWKRLDSEARAVARLQHPNIVQIYEVGQADGQPFLALEFVEGQSLPSASTAPPGRPARPRLWSRCWPGPCTTPTPGESFTATSSRPTSSSRP
jgi:serine/threonine protein kinase